MDTPEPNRVRVPLLVPDMPAAAALLPWLERIDAQRRYANFGALACAFEDRLSAQWAAPPEVVSTSSGTAALEVGIAALGIAAGSAALVPAFTFAATASAAIRNRLDVVFSDVAADSWQLTPAIAREVAKRRKLGLVIPVATFGCAVSAAAWDVFTQETGIPVLVDAAAAFGNQEIGTLTSCAFSFHATKPFGIGEGGAFVTRERALARRARRLSNFGYENRVSHEAGTNAKLSEFAAAVGLAQAERWAERQQRRRGLWAAYHAALAKVPGVRLQATGDSLPAVCVLRVPRNADRVCDALGIAGIETRRWYCPPLHRHPAFAACGRDDLRETQLLAREALGVPWFGLMTEAQCDGVAGELATALEMPRCLDAF